MIYLLDRVQEYFSKYYEFNDVEVAKLRYSLEVIISEMTKSIFLILFFYLFKLHWDVVYCLITLSTLRSFTGGLHFKTYSTCLLFTGLFIGVTIGLKHYIPISFNLFIISLIFAILVNLLFAPLPSNKRPKYSKEKKIKFKIIALLVLASYFIFFLATNKSTFFTIAIWIAILQSIQLIIMKGVQYHEKHVQKSN